MKRREFLAAGTAGLIGSTVTADALWGWHEPGELLLAVQKDNVTIATHAF